MAYFKGKEKGTARKGVVARVTKIWSAAPDGDEFSPDIMMQREWMYPVSLPPVTRRRQGLPECASPTTASHVRLRIWFIMLYPCRHRGWSCSSSDLPRARMIKESTRGEMFGSDMQHIQDWQKLKKYIIKYKNTKRNTKENGKTKRQNADQSNSRFNFKQAKKKS